MKNQEVPLLPLEKLGNKKIICFSVGERPGETEAFIEALYNDDDSKSRQYALIIREETGYFHIDKMRDPLHIMTNIYETIPFSNYKLRSFYYGSY